MHLVEFINLLAKRCSLHSVLSLLTAQTACWQSWLYWLI